MVVFFCADLVRHEQIFIERIEFIERFIDPPQQLQLIYVIKLTFDSIKFFKSIFLLLFFFHCRIGLSGFDNPMRDPKTEELKRHVGQVIFEFR